MFDGCAVERVRFAPLALSVWNSHRSVDQELNV